MIVEKNPCKVLFTVAGTTLVLAESERFLGGDEIVFGKDGNPQVVSKPGLIGRMSENAMNIGKVPIQWSIYAVGGVVAASLALLIGAFGSLKFWKHLSKDRIEVGAAKNAARAQLIPTRSVVEEQTTEDKVTGCPSLTRSRVGL